MTRGEHVERLGTYVRNADPDHLAEAAASWYAMLHALNDTRAMLRHVANVARTELEGDYAVSATQRLDELAVVTIDRMREVRVGGQALIATSDALAHAKQVYEDSRGPSGDTGDRISGGRAVFVGGSSSGIDYATDPYSADAIQYAQLKSQQNQHDARAFDTQESRAKAETDYLDHVFSQTDQSMTDVHRSSTSDFGSTRPMEPGAHDPSPLPDVPDHHHVPPPRPVGPTDPSTDPATAPVSVQPVTGSAQGAGATATLPSPAAGSAVTSAGASGVGGSGGSVGSSGGVYGGLYGGGSGVGGGLFGGGGSGTLSASGVRGIGAPGSTVARAGGMSSGGGMGVRGGSGAGGRGAGGAGGRAGAGRGRSGVGAGGRGGRRKDDDERDEREIADEDPSQWLDDEDVAPDVLGETAPFVEAPPGLEGLGDVDGADGFDAFVVDGELVDVEELEDLGIDDLDDLDDLDLAGWLTDPEDLDDAPDAGTAGVDETGEADGVGDDGPAVDPAEERAREEQTERARVLQEQKAQRDRDDLRRRLSSYGQ